MTWASNVQAVTLFIDDLEVAREFYGRAFDKDVYFQNDDSVVFEFGPVLINLLLRRQADELIAPATVGMPGAGVQVQFTISVDDVDAVALALTERGVTLLRGPEDRPWGIRTATFQDPFGHTWEIAS